MVNTSIMETDIKDTCATQLKELAQYTSHKEQIAAKDVAGISKPTLYKYLNGEVANIDIATKLIGHLAPIAKARKEQLEKSATKSKTNSSLKI